MLVFSILSQDSMSAGALGGAGEASAGRAELVSPRPEGMRQTELGPGTSPFGQGAAVDIDRRRRRLRVAPAVAPPMSHSEVGSGDGSLLRVVRSLGW